MSERTGQTIAVPVYMRSGPGIQHPAAATLPPVTPFTVLMEMAPWLHIHCDLGEGYLHQNFATLDPIEDWAVSFALEIVRTGKARNFLNLRSGPGTHFDRIVVLAPETPLEIQSQEGVWLKVSAEGVVGYVHSDFVVLDPLPTPTIPPGTNPPPQLPVDIRPGEENLQPPAHEMLTAPVGSDTTTRSVARIWNRFGGLFQELSQQLRIDPGVAVAVFLIESGGEGFGSDGRLKIRFENHVFRNYWGKLNPDRFAQHFRHDSPRTWENHFWRPHPDGEWLSFHGNQAKEWEVFNFARTLDDTAAKMCISMGGPQIMGFNHATTGFESVHQMFDAFAQGNRGQIIGFFRFVQGGTPNSQRLVALQTLDFEKFASLYNGPGQAARYAGLIQGAYERFRQLRG
ncbi:MAG: SH3 domain-containing protein [Anaerolineae bacterium]|nr:SH3 domain-containing protein [Anaerolineae bacterium]